MAFESVNYQCPACGGPLHFASAEQKLVCDYCDSRFEVEEVEALYRERQDKADAKADAAAAAPKPAVDDAVQELAQNAGYICSSCGAELVSDGTVAVTTCPYCGNSAVAPGQLSGDFSPDLVIPFKLGRDDVMTALKEHYKGKILLPKSFVTGNHIDEVQGVYVPFWLYGARVDGEVYFDATNETVTEESDRTVTTTDHYDAYRKGNISFERVPSIVWKKVRFRPYARPSSTNMTTPRSKASSSTTPGKKAIMPCSPCGCFPPRGTARATCLP